MSFAAMMLIGMALDVVLGWPARLYARIGHPVTWLGRLIGALEARWNRGTERGQFWRGAAATALVVLAACLPMFWVQSHLPEGVWGMVMGGVLAWPLIAVRAMHDHVRDVARPLLAGDLDAARGAVAMIVGRDPAQLDGAGVARAATESLAENTGDGIVAPVFWGVVAGLPGIAAYKAINTLDSMIGHCNARYEQFGKCAARLDDVVNWLPARLTGLLFAIASRKQMGQAMHAMLRDARHHRSPNAGWPEGAMAGALGVRLSGPRIYGTRKVDEPWLNGDAPDPGAKDLARALSLYIHTMAGLALVLVLLAMV